MIFKDPEFLRHISQNSLDIFLRIPTTENVTSLFQVFNRKPPILP